MDHTSSRPPTGQLTFVQSNTQVSSRPASSPRADARAPLASLETVCTVAREGSFLAAAGTAGLTHGAISRRVAAVENWLGMALFERHAPPN